MPPSTATEGLAIPLVLPILPAAVGLIWVVVTSLGTMLLAALALRKQAGRKLLRGIWRQKWGLLIWGAVIAAAVQVPALLRSPDPIATQPPDWEAASWPMFRGDPGRSGNADSEPGPKRGTIQWSGGRDFEFLSTAAVAGDHVVALGFEGDSARLFAWEADSGRPLPLPSPTDYRASFSSPVIAEGLLVFGEGLHYTTNGRVFCFDLRSPQFWQQPLVFETSSHVECTPVIDGGRVYVNAGDDGVYCLFVDRAARLLQKVWHAPGSNLPDAETALAVHQGRVYVGLGNGGDAVCVLDAESGTEIRRVSLPWPVFSPPAIAAGQLYVGLGRADYVHEDSSPGAVCCLDLESLNETWRFPTDAAVLAAVVANRDEILFSTVNGDVIGLSEDGTERNRWRTNSRVLSAPAVTKDHVYCVSTDGLLTVLDRENLQPSASVRLGPPGRYVSSPVVFRGRVYVGTPSAGFLCIGEAE